MSASRILLVDDHELFREGLVGLINAQSDLKVVGQASDGFEVLSLARDLCPDLIVMDVSMPVCKGPEATALIRATPEISGIPIIILTIHEEDEHLFAAIKAGANGYLLKSTNSRDFLRGIREVLVGGSSLSPKMATRLLQEFALLADRPPDSLPAEETPDLTPREVEVLGLIATGASDKEIAAQLSLSLHTVKSHVRNILSKLHATNRRQVVKLAQQQGLLRD